MSPEDEAAILHSFHDDIISYVVSALVAGLSLRRSHRIWNLSKSFGVWPWAVVVEEQKLFLIANFALQIQEIY